jgi:hypothetical protein
MKAFFKQELETLQAKTGIRQLETLMQKEDWKKEANLLIDLMITECNKPPFNLVTVTVKERVISRAIVEDQEFTGLNAKFVRRALNAWWNINGDRVLMARNEMQRDAQPVVLTPEDNDKVNVLLESYRRRLLSGDGPKMVPKIESQVAEKEGAEWQSEIEKKAHKYVPLVSREEQFIRQKIRRAGSEFYKNRQSFNLKEFIVEDVPIMAESEEDALEIYRIATEKN